MKLLSRKKFNWNYTLLAFLLPVTGLFIMMIIRGFEPFGKTTMLYSDMYHQYYPFFVNYREALLSGDSLLYNWNLGMGMDYLGLISYYLASPLNLLSVFVPESLLLEYFSLLMPIKLGLASMFFAIFLKKLFRKNDFSIAAFGCLYGLCAWALGYQWNIMWLDSFALLPLVALGTVSLLENRKFLLYTLTLFLSVFSNYYIGLFVCIFVALTVLCYEICRWKGFGKLFRDIGVMALYSLLAIGMTAILELPAFAALQNTQSSVNTFPKEFRLNIVDTHTWKGLLEAMGQVAGNTSGGIVPTYKEGLPNLYCGICTNLLATAFLTCKQVKLRDKLCSMALLIFFNASFVIRQLDYIWHGFHFTNMIPYRFSFLYSFVMLYMAYRAFLLRKQFKLWQILVAGLAAFGLMLCFQGEKGLVYWAYNGVFLILYILILLFPLLRKKPAPDGGPDAIREYQTQKRSARAFSAGAFLVILCIEMCLNLLNFGIDFTGTSVSNYPRGRKNTEAAIAYMKEQSAEDLFYRAEATHSQTLNDSALNGYSGISSFTSSANVRVTKFMKALGYGAKETYNRYCFEESSPVSNLFLNLKYMIERSGDVEENIYFDEVFKKGSVSLLENNAYLPLGFVVDNQILNVDFYGAENTFLLQNDLFKKTTGLTEDVWYEIEGKGLTVTGENVTVKPQTRSGYCYYSSVSGGTVTYRYVVRKDGLFCMDLVLPRRNSFSVWKNGTELYSETYSIPQSLAVSQVAIGDEIEIRVNCSANQKSSITIRGAILDDALFREGYEILSASTLKLTTFENTKVAGTVSCEKAGILYTSIPYDGNWSATVDGKPVQIIEIGGAMVGILLPEGTHTVSFTYHSEAFSLGWKLTLVCTVIFLGLVLSIYKPQNAIKRYITKRKTERRNQHDTTVTDDTGEVSGS